MIRRIQLVVLALLLAPALFAQIQFTPPSNTTAAAMTIGGAVTGGTATRVLYNDASGQLGESANFTFVPATNVFTLNGPVVVGGTGTTSTAKTLVVNNGAATGSILEVQDNGTPALTVADGGTITFGTNVVTCGGASCVLTASTGNTFGYNSFHTVQNNAATNAFVTSQSSHGFNSTGTAAAGFGWGSVYKLESSTTNSQDAIAVGARWLVATHDAEHGEFLVQTVSGGAALADVLTVSAGHIKVAGTAPTITSCGTGTPTIAGSDAGGKVTAGGGAVTACVLTFAVAYAVAPACVANNETTAQIMQAVSATTTLTINGADFNGDVVSYICMGR